MAEMSTQSSEASHNPPPPSPTNRPVKGILKKGKEDGKITRLKSESKEDQPAAAAAAAAAGAVQWDEMNILMTEHPPGKDYGHMKIDEPKTPYHEMLEDEEAVAPQQGLLADALAERVLEAAEEGPQKKWESESSGSEVEMDDQQLTEEEKEHNSKFRDWRKKHYNEYYAVKRARELIKQDFEELEKEEKKASQDEGDEHMQEDSPPTT